MAKTKAEFIASCFENEAISVFEVTQIGQKECIDIDQDWHDEVTSYEFDDGSILSVFNDTVEAK